MRVEKTDGTVISHAYDADGNRVRTDVTRPTGPPQLTEFLVDTTVALSHVVAESDIHGNLVVYYVRGDDLLSVIRASKQRFYHADGIGSIRILTDESSNVTDSYELTAFGEQLSHIGSDDQPYRFAGEPYDLNIGFYYNRARWLDPTVGRFASMDDWKISVFDPASLHLYLYSASDPINKIDPTGRQFSTMQLMAVGAIIGVIAAQAQIALSAVRLSLKDQLLITFAWAALGASLGALYAGVLLPAGAAGATGAAAQGAVRFDWTRAGHIFRDAVGHVNPLSEATRIRFAQLFEAVASNPANFRPGFPLPPAAQAAGVQVFTQVFRNGQVWVYVQGGEILDAGMNLPGFFR